MGATERVDFLILEDEREISEGTVAALQATLGCNRPNERKQTRAQEEGRSGGCEQEPRAESPGHITGR
jgi:hypothetical protein